jgi:hypothetical protein
MVLVLVQQRYTHQPIEQYYLSYWSCQQYIATTTQYTHWLL